MDLGTKIITFAISELHDHECMRILIKSFLLRQHLKAPHSEYTIKQSDIPILHHERSKKMSTGDKQVRYHSS